MLKRLAIITSGGDAPGMNATTRAVVRTAINNNIRVFSFTKGFDGIIDNKISEMNGRSVSNIIQAGGTIIKTGRSERFREEEWIKRAAEVLEKNNIDGLIANGGNGTMKGLFEFQKIWKTGQIIGIPGTIDNDIYGTDYSIGFDTAVNTALDAIDKIRDTAFSHDNAFIIEVMGRHSGFIALEVALAGGCEECLIPEVTPNLKDLAERYIENKKKGKQSIILILAEGALEGKGAHYVKNQLEDLTKDKWRVTIIGYLQRGGQPTADDRILGTKLGSYAVDCFLNGDTGIMIGEVNKSLSKVPLDDVFNKRKEIDHSLLKLIAILQ